MTHHIITAVQKSYISFLSLSLISICGVWDCQAASVSSALTPDPLPELSFPIPEVADTTVSQELDEFVLTQKKRGAMKSFGVENNYLINQTELYRAACCNLGESFITSPSVDVSYSDAATGARQIKLLGLSGTYVQMLTETMPAFRGAASPYGFRYVPGPWMKSISVSKGSSTVKNGYESITGQINIEYLKPQDEPGFTANAYFDSDMKLELNADGNIHIKEGLTTELLAHFEDRFGVHDNNKDGFADMPDIRQINLNNRWQWRTGRYIFHGGVSMINEKSNAGQTSVHNHSGSTLVDPFLIDLYTHRYEAYMKHAYIFDPDRNGNIAFIGAVNMHLLDASFGRKSYRVNEKGAYAQLMYETDLGELHNISAGLSFNYDYLGQKIKTTHNPDKGPEIVREREGVAGAYAQYTFTHSDRLILMAGLRGDYSSRYKWFVTPRFNIKYTPLERLNLRVSVGKGYRTVHPWAEYNNLLASGRTIVVDELKQEEAWNYGISADYTQYIGSHKIILNVEYFYTDFKSQAIVDYDSDPGYLTIAQLDGKSYSHTLQTDLTWESPFGLSITGAYRLNDVKSTYGGVLLEKPLTNRYKALITTSYSTPLELWQFDVTFQMNGGGRLPAPYMLPDGNMSWGPRFKAFPQLNLQVTRWFRNFSIYAGGENLTGFKQKNPVVWSSDPWSSYFDPTTVWAPIHGAMAYIGIRFNFGRL
ncbi:MAG: TonB-dependent receptor [Muribaculaceae bacterium]|nr:TonB-dependent receptor [Muribaculaceae bacterium]